MKTINVLILLAIFNLFITTYSMKIPEKVFWLQTTDTKNMFTNEKKTVPIGLKDASYSSYISVLNEISISNNTPLEDLWEYLSKDKLFKKKEIKLFKNLLHKPNLYHSLKNKEYYQALFIAEKFKAPLLYAELLGAKLPKAAMTLITQQYICLHHMPYALIDKIRHKEIIALVGKYKKELYIDAEKLSNKHLQKTLIKKNKILENYIAWSDDLKILFNDLMQNAILPQALLLSLICNAPKSSRIKMKLVSSTPGFKAFTSLLNYYDEEFLLHALRISTYYKRGRANKIYLIALTFKV